MFQVENDKFCNKVLEKNFPNVKRYRDIHEFNGKEYRGSIDIISGGFPCQPVSQAGKRQGEKDNRWLWPEMLRIIGEIRPRWVVGENVAGLIPMEDGRTLEGILSGLENEGYEVQSYIIPACGVGAWHRRDRIWIVAHENSHGFSTNKRKSNTRTNRRHNVERIRENVSNPGLQRQEVNEKQTARTEQRGETIPDTDNKGSQGHGEPGKRAGECPAWTICPEQVGKTWELEPPVGRVVTGLPGRVDRLKALGNAVVPQVPYEIFRAINKIEKPDKLPRSRA